MQTRSVFDYLIILSKKKDQSINRTEGASAMVAYNPNIEHIDHYIIHVEDNRKSDERKGV